MQPNIVFAKQYEHSEHEHSENERIQRTQYEQEIVPLLTEQTRDIEKIAALGELDMFILLETMTRTLNTKQRLIELRVSELDAMITVLRILGPDTRQAPLPTGEEDETSPTAPQDDEDIVAGGMK